MSAHNASPGHFRPRQLELKERTSKGAERPSFSPDLSPENAVEPPRKDDYLFLRSMRTCQSASTSVETPLNPGTGFCDGTGLDPNLTGLDATHRAYRQQLSLEEGELRSGSESEEEPTPPRRVCPPSPTEGVVPNRSPSPGAALAQLKDSVDESFKVAFKASKALKVARSRKTPSPAPTSPIRRRVPSRGDGEVTLRYDDPPVNLADVSSRQLARAYWEKGDEDEGHRRRPLSPSTDEEEAGNGKTADDDVNWDNTSGESRSVSRENPMTSKASSGRKSSPSPRQRLTPTPTGRVLPGSPSPSPLHGGRSPHPLYGHDDRRISPNHSSAIARSLFDDDRQSSSHQNSLIARSLFEPPEPGEFTGSEPPRYLKAWLSPYSRPDPGSGACERAMNRGRYDASRYLDDDDAYHGYRPEYGSDSPYNELQPRDYGSRERVSYDRQRSRSRSLDRQPRHSRSRTGERHHRTSNRTSRDRASRQDRSLSGSKHSRDRGSGAGSRLLEGRRRSKSRSRGSLSRDTGSRSLSGDRPRQSKKRKRSSSKKRSKRDRSDSEVESPPRKKHKNGKKKKKARKQKRNKSGSGYQSNSSKSNLEHEISELVKNKRRNRRKSDDQKAEPKQPDANTSRSSEGSQFIEIDAIEGSPVKSNEKPDSAAEPERKTDSAMSMSERKTDSAMSIPRKTDSAMSISDSGSGEWIPARCQSRVDVDHIPMPAPSAAPMSEDYDPEEPLGPRLDLLLKAIGPVVSASFSKSEISQSAERAASQSPERTVTKFSAIERILEESGSTCSSRSGPRAPPHRPKTPENTMNPLQQELLAAALENRHPEDSFKLFDAHKKLDADTSSTHESAFSGGSRTTTPVGDQPSTSAGTDLWAGFQGSRPKDGADPWAALKVGLSKIQGDTGVALVTKAPLSMEIAVPDLTISHQLKDIVSTYSDSHKRSEPTSSKISPAPPPPLPANESRPPPPPPANQNAPGALPAATSDISSLLAQLKERQASTSTSQSKSNREAGTSASQSKSSREAGNSASQPKSREEPLASILTRLETITGDTVKKPEPKDISSGSGTKNRFEYLKEMMGIASSKGRYGSPQPSTPAGTTPVQSASGTPSSAERAPRLGESYRTPTPLFSEADVDERTPPRPVSGTPQNGPAAPSDQDSSPEQTAKNLRCKRAALGVMIGAFLRGSPSKRPAPEEPAEHDVPTDRIPLPPLPPIPEPKPGPSTLSTPTAATEKITRRPRFSPENGAEGPSFSPDKSDRRARLSTLNPDILRAMAEGDGPPSSRAQLGRTRSASSGEFSPPASPTLPREADGADTIADADIVEGDEADSAEDPDTSIEMVQMEDAMPCETHGSSPVSPWASQGSADSLRTDAPESPDANRPVSPSQLHPPCSPDPELFPLLSTPKAKPIPTSPEKPKTVVPMPSLLATTGLRAEPVVIPTEELVCPASPDGITPASPDGIVIPISLSPGPSDSPQVIEPIGASDLVQNSRKFIEAYKIFQRDLDKPPCRLETRSVTPPHAQETPHDRRSNSPAERVRHYSAERSRDRSRVGHEPSTSGHRDSSIRFSVRSREERSEVASLARTSPVERSTAASVAGVERFTCTQEGGVWSYTGMPKYDVAKYGRYGVTRPLNVPPDARSMLVQALTRLKREKMGEQGGPSTS